MTRSDHSGQQPSHTRRDGHGDGSPDEYPERWPQEPAVSEHSNGPDGLERIAQAPDMIATDRPVAPPCFCAKQMGAEAGWVSVN